MKDLTKQLRGYCGHMKKWQKETEYHWRINNYQYNILVEKADRIATILKKYGY